MATTRKNRNKTTVPSPLPLRTLRSKSAAKQSHSSGKDSTLFVHSVDKAMQVLMAFDGTQTKLSLSQIAERTGFDLSAVQRFTYTLITLQYLIKDEETKKYELSPRLLDFSYRYLASNDLAHRAIPYIQKLAQETDEATNLTVLDDTDIVFVMRIASRHMLAPNVIVGTRIPAYCTGPGLAILAHLPTAQVDDILLRSDLVPVTPYTITDVAKIHARLEKIRAEGYVRAIDEYFLGDISTAAAILNGRGQPIGAVNVSVTKSRWKPARDEKRITELVMSTAAAISV